MAPSTGHVGDRSSLGQYHTNTDAWWPNRAVKMFLAAGTGRLVSIVGKMNAAMYRDTLEESVVYSTLDLRLG